MFLPQLDELARLIRLVAQEEILPRFSHAERRFKNDGSIVTEADYEVQGRLAEALRCRYPEFDLLGEEMDEAQQRALLAREGKGLWCLDPVDGTSNFAAGLPFFGVSLALLIDRAPALGVVYDPVRDECFTAERGKGAFLNGARLRCLPPGLSLRRCLAVVDFKRIHPRLAAELVSHPPYSSQRNLGSVALEWCWLAAGRFHVYLHGKQNLWDYAAGALVFDEAGGSAATLDGEPVYAPELRPRSVAAATDRELFVEWRDWIARHSPGASG